MLSVWNASSSIVKQNDRKTQIALSKSFSLFDTTYIEDIKNFLKDFRLIESFLNFRKMWNWRFWITRNNDNMWNERKKITTMELKMRNLSLRIKCILSKINSAFFCSALFRSTFISLVQISDNHTKIREIIFSAIKKMSVHTYGIRDSNV